MKPFEAGRVYVRRGWAPVPVPYREKGPVLKDWPDLRLTDADEGFNVSASLPYGDVVVELDLAVTVDVAAERKRLEKDVSTARKEVEAAAAKLGNEAFLAKAPEPVVEKIRTRLAGAEADVARIEGQLAALPAS